MAAVKTMREKMANEGLTSFIVTYDYYEDDTEAAEAGGGIPDPDDVYKEQYWATDATHAAEQFTDSDSSARILTIETQEGYELRTGEELDYGNRENV